jgi:hypothetical protein
MWWSLDEPDVSRVLEIVRPAVHAKAQITPKQTVPERKQVLSYGGQVRITGDSKDHSTRDVIREFWKPMESKSIKPNISRFLIVKFGSLVDIVHCLPSVAQLRSAFPKAEIDWLVERKNKIAVDLSGLDVRVVPIDTYLPLAQ